MQIEMVKNAGGVFCPAFEHDLPRLTKFKNGEMYTAEIKLTRNPAFHRKAFAFFNFCFQHWAADRAGLEHMDEYSQFDRFRKDLTILAGFYEQTVRLNGDIRTEAKSLAYANMEPDEFERCYSALINAAIKHVFAGTKDENTINQLQNFF
ncbi:DUF1367 family protein [Pectobacterium brasiliense]|uniref:DUF1367 family protein n=1 Tax=Pectobacterium brasiliense TaxID=180957 RepID=UPI001969983E|nr:DUF1367 family protein [Pectobacterium brasiliense]MBN3043325.1 DUF1367 family protein [Pectobacterium brasiliense]